MKPVTLGLIVGNRGFFPSHLCKTGRETVLRVLEEEGFKVVVLSPEETAHGSVESLTEAQKYADLFKKNRDTIDGVLVTLPNFGDERAIANTLRWAGLDVPVLVHAFNDDMTKMDLQWRRDSFCGKMSACNNLHQYGIKFSLTTLHTMDPESAAFRADLNDFAATCRVVRGLRGLRIGFLGARPPAFNTVRFSEKLLERSGISVETLDLSDAYGRIGRLTADSPKVKAKLEKIHAYVRTGNAPAESLDKMARFGVVVDDWMAESNLQATAIQCWTSMEEFFGVVPCTLMSIMSDNLMASACETDVAGTVAMQALVLASGKPSALVDWNNNYGDDPNKCVFFHCGNWAKAFIPDAAIKTAPILGTTLGEENTFGAMAGRTPAGPVTFARITTDDVSGVIRSYVGEGRFTDDRLDTFGTRAVVQVPGLQSLMKYICKNGFEHHVAMNASLTSAVLAEAFTTYFDWDVYAHSAA